jgi:transposase
LSVACDDQAAVVAALCSPHSQGQTEGQVNRLKMLKRQTTGERTSTLVAESSPRRLKGWLGTRPT